MSYLHFKNAYDRTMRIEGGISDHKFDPGGLTFMGISRYWHPSWSGWVAIDKVKKTSDLEADTLDILKIKVELFYKEQFWDRIQGDGLSALSPVIASVVFDAAVNPGVSRSVEFLQDSLSLLNLNKKLYPDLSIDGKLGPRTLGRLERYLTLLPASKETKETRLLEVFSFLRGGYYIKKMRENPNKEVFRGWFERAAAW